MKKTTLLTTIALSLAASPAFAHLNPAEHGSFAAGFSHPLSGLDHILAMVAVGLWAAMLGGRALLEQFQEKCAAVFRPELRKNKKLERFRVSVKNGNALVVPAAFVGVMLLGFVAGLYGMPLLILASVVVLGLLVALALRVPAATGAVIVGFFAFFHGHAHGAEIGAAAFASYAAGFAISTALLHGAGILVGLGLGRLGARDKALVAMRIAGGATALAGIALAITG
ncbi:MAG TPA: HupE/UreJ family protein [Mesorhizobium sp.]|jgi:urease accessory protein|uniref:HupE/UreJ family protein n=1 Tax=Mesorhizobium sp. TaxID=1871066 RepID=UPI002DDCDCD9|nr:HupE/UreJ family protein [Mesorhizobium sp.]HEV2507185.1 HupE/UreJ family protein [Mesorhizobium sp.]